MIEEEIQILSPFREKLAVTVVKAQEHDSPLVIMAPGFTSKRKNGTNTAIRQSLYKQGISSILVDLSGHGDSEGSIAEQTIRKASIEIECIYNACLQFNWINPNRIGVLGTSFSGTAMIVFAEKHPELKCISLKSPITNYYGTRLYQLGEEKIKDWKKNSQITLNDGTISKKQFLEDAKSINVYNIIQKINTPVFIVQGNNDEDIPNEHIQKLQSVLPENASINIIDGCDHGYTNPQHLNLMIEKISNFLIGKLKS